MRRIIFPILFFVCWFASSTTSLRAEGLKSSTSRFYYKDAKGKVTGVRIVRRYWKTPIVHPPAKLDPRIDPKLRRAATLAQERANARSKARCWRYVKQALVASGAVNSYPKTAYAYQAGAELVQNHGFKRLPVRDPYAAPIGAVLVYSHGPRRPGHVEIRTRHGFVSDYHSKDRCRYRLLAVYGKFSS